MARPSTATDARTPLLSLLMSARSRLHESALATTHAAATRPESRLLHGDRSHMPGWEGGGASSPLLSFVVQDVCQQLQVDLFPSVRALSLLFSCSGLRTADPEGCCRCSLDLPATAYCTPNKVAAFVRAPSRPAHCVLVRLERLRRQSSHMHCCGVIIAPVHKECPRHIASRSWLLLRHQTLAAGKAAR